MNGPDFTTMEDVPFLKWLSVFLHDCHGFSTSGPVLRRLVALTKHLEAEQLSGEAIGEPDADNPTELRDSLVKIVHKGYIGVTPSKAKAEKVVDAVLQELEQFYEQAEVQGEVVDAVLQEQVEQRAEQ